MPETASPDYTTGSMLFVRRSYAKSRKRRDWGRSLRLDKYGRLGERKVNTYGERPSRAVWLKLADRGLRATSRNPRLQL